MGGLRDPVLANLIHLPSQTIQENLIHNGFQGKDEPSVMQGQAGDVQIGKQKGGAEGSQDFAVWLTRSVGNIRLSSYLSTDTCLTYFLKTQPMLVSVTRRSRSDECDLLTDSLSNRSY